MRRQRATHADVSDNAVRIGEITGVISIGGNVYAGYTAAGELLIATSTANKNFAFEIRRHIPVVVPAAATPYTGVRVAIGWSADTTVDVAELTAESLTDSVIVPTNTLNQYFLIWTADAVGTLQAIHYGSSPNNLGVYSAPVALERNGIDGTVRVSNSLLIGRRI